MRQINTLSFLNHQYFRYTKYVTEKDFVRGLSLYDYQNVSRKVQSLKLLNYNKMSSKVSKMNLLLIRKILIKWLKKW